MVRGLVSELAHQVGRLNPSRRNLFRECRIISSKLISRRRPWRTCRTVHRCAINCEENPVHMWLVTVKEVAHFEPEHAVFGSQRAPLGNSASDAIALSSAPNHRRPLSPACCDRSQSRMDSASHSASAVPMSCLRHRSARNSEAGRVWPAFTSS